MPGPAFSNILAQELWPQTSLHIDQPYLLEGASKLSVEQFYNLLHFSLGPSTLSPEIAESRFKASVMPNILLLPTSLRGFHLILGHIFGWHITSLCRRFQDLDDLPTFDYTLKPCH